MTSGKYDSQDWASFLKDAQRRHSHNRKNEYVAYEEQIRASMRKYLEESKTSLDLSYDQYLEATTESFAKKNYHLYCDEQLTDTKLKKILSRCKILILTANPIEKAMFHYLIAAQKNSRKILRIIYDQNVYFIMKWGEYWIAHVPQSETGNKDHGASATIYEALKYFTPHVIISLGVAFGIDYSKQKIGDVIVSQKLLPYSENKRDEEKIKPDRTQDKQIDHWLRIRFVNATGFLDGVTYGSILTGGSVISSVTEKDKICLGYTNTDFVIGGEMEGNAVFQYANSYNIPCAVIKGICDWGVAKNSILKEVDKEANIDSEEKLKNSLQAFAMQSAFEKCIPLFSDKTLFCSSKNFKLENLQRRYNASRICLQLCLLLTLVTGALFILRFYFPFEIRNLHFFYVGCIMILFSVVVELLNTKAMYSYLQKEKKRALEAEAEKAYVSN